MENPVKAPPPEAKKSDAKKSSEKTDLKSPAKKPGEDRKKRAMSQEKVGKKDAANNDNGTHISPPRRYGLGLVQ